MREIAPEVDKKKIPLIVSIAGTRKELVEMTDMLNDVDIVGIEINVSCPNTDHLEKDVSLVAGDVKSVRDKSEHPVLIKVSVDQPCCEIVTVLEAVAEAVALNSVLWEKLFSAPNGQLLRRSPLWRLQKRVGGGGGGVSGLLAQKLNWNMVQRLRIQAHAMPIIGPSVMSAADVVKVRQKGAEAVSFGSIHLRTPWKPTQIVEEELALDSV
jgi:dihydroorotate dehydrogenase